MFSMQPFIAGTITVLEIAGAGVIILGAFYSTARALVFFARRPAGRDIFTDYRRELARGILLGLEFLIAADIIRTVAVRPTFYGVGVLAVLVLIRTFLSFTLEMEITGRWPWQEGSRTKHQQVP